MITILMMTILIVKIRHSRPLCCQSDVSHKTATLCTSLLQNRDFLQELFYLRLLCTELSTQGLDFLVNQSWVKTLALEDSDLVLQRR